MEDVGTDINTVHVEFEGFTPLTVTNPTPKRHNLLRAMDGP